MKTIDLMANGSMYFMIGDRNVTVTEKTYITTGLIDPLGDGDEIHCEGKYYKIDSVSEERAQVNSPNRTFQKLEVTRIEKPW